ncbi:MAG: NnrU family protein [Burkholderiales bacterium]
MTLLIIGLIVFLGLHSVSIVAPGWRNAQVARFGEGSWKGIYSVVSLVGLALLIIGYGAARQSPVVLYVPPTWLRHVSLLLMVPVFPLLIAAYVPGWISRTAKHPMLLAVKFWALAHLLANGTLADVLLFGGFLAWAVADRISMKRRTSRDVPHAPASRANDAIVVVGGLALYVLFVWRLHLWLIGVSPVG